MNRGGRREEGAGADGGEDEDEEDEDFEMVAPTQVIREPQAPQSPAATAGLASGPLAVGGPFEHVRSPPAGARAGSPARGNVASVQPALTSPAPKGGGLGADVFGLVSRGAGAVAAVFQSGFDVMSPGRGGKRKRAAAAGAEYWQRGRDTWPAEKAVLAHFLGARAAAGASAGAGGRPPGAAVPASQAPVSLAEAVDW